MMSNESFLQCLDRFVEWSIYGLLFFTPISNGGVETFSVLILLAYVLRQSIKPTRKIKEIFNHPATRPLIVFLAICFLSILANPYWGKGFNGFFCELLPCVWVYLIILDVMSQEKKLKRMLFVLLFAFVLVGLSGLFQYFFGVDFLRWSELYHGRRVSSSLPAANGYAVYLESHLPTLILLSGLWIKKAKFNLAPRISQWIPIITGFGIFLLGLTFSRAGWMTFFLSMLVLGFFQKQLRVALSVLLGLFALYFPWALISQREHVDLSNLFTLFGREAFWMKALEVAFDHPLVGAGLNAYTYALQNYGVLWRNYPHNCYLQMAAEVGFLGLAAFLWFVWVVFQQGIQAYRSTKSSDYKILLLGVMVGFGAYLFHSFFDTFFHSTQLGMLMWLLMAILGVITKAVLSKEIKT